MTTGKLIDKLQPTAGCLLVEPEEEEKRTASGIVLPETHEEKPQQGKVLAVGDDEMLDSGGKRKSPVPVGARIIYKKWGGSEVKIEGKEYLFVKFEDVLAVIK